MLLLIQATGLSFPGPAHGFFLLKDLFFARHLAQFGLFQCGFHLNSSVSAAIASSEVCLEGHEWWSYIYFYLLGIGHRSL